MRKIVKITGLCVKNCSTKDVLFSINEMTCKNEEPIEIDWREKNQLTVYLLNGESCSSSLFEIPKTAIIWEEKEISFFLVEMN